jgi:hypothetical protein
MQGLKSIGNAETTFPGRQAFGRKVGPFSMRNQEDRLYFEPQKKTNQK